jgi:hypothetical protein
MSADTERDILAGQPGHFGQTESRLHRHQEKRVIAAAKPGALVRSCEQGLDLRTREKMHQGPRKALAGNRQDALNLRGVSGCFEGGVSKERVDGREPKIPAPHAQPSMLLYVIEKRRDQWRIDRLESQARRGRVQPLLHKRQQQTEGVAIRTDGMRAGLPLLHQPLRKEPFQQGRETGGAGGHD